METVTFMPDIIDRIFTNFDFSFMFAVNALTYFIIKMLEEINEDIKIKTYQKRLVLLIMIICIAAIYKIVGYPNDIVLINSSILAPVFWSWFLRPILIKIGLGYKKNIK